VLGTGELKQYDVSDPAHPREAGSVRLGGIVSRTPYRAAPELRLGGAPRVVEVSRDGRRVYFTNSLYASWDEILYSHGVGTWMARIDADTGSAARPSTRGSSPAVMTSVGCGCTRRLQAGDASSGSYCFVE
jgi:selenium-binding protein 1